MAFMSFIRFQRSASARRWVQWIMGIIAAIFIVGAFFSFGGSPGMRAHQARMQAPAFTVNGEPVTTQWYEFVIKRQQDQMRMFGGGGTDPTSQRQIKLAVLDQLTQHLAQMQDAKSMGLQVSSDEISTKREQWIQDQIASIGTGAARARALQERDQTEEEFVAEIEQTAKSRTEDFRNEILLEKHKEAIVAGVTITDEQFEQMYTKLDLRDIVIKVDDDAVPPKEAAAAEEEPVEDSEESPTEAAADEPEAAEDGDADEPETEAEAEPGDESDAGRVDEEAKAIINEVHAKALAGEDFEELAKQYSEDTFAAERGGEMSLKRGDWHLNLLGNDFFDAVYALEEGEISEPIRADDGYHIVKLIKSEEDKPEDFEDRKEELRTQKLDAEKDRVYREYTEGLKENAEVVINDQQLKAYTLAEEQNYAEALALLEEYVRQQEEEAAAAREAAGAAAKDEPYQSPVSGETWYEIARLHQLLGQPDEAETYYAKAIEFFDCPELHLELGKMLKDLGRAGDAVTEFQAASKQAYSNQYIHYELKQLFMELGRDDLAEAEQRQIDEFGAQGGGMPMSFGM